jgi:hypothetical protein
VDAIIRRTSIVVEWESGKAAVGSIKHALRRHAGEPAPAQRRRRHLHRRCKGLPEIKIVTRTIMDEWTDDRTMATGSSVTWTHCNVRYEVTWG